jgi:hypothetical protein
VACLESIILLAFEVREPVFVVSAIVASELSCHDRVLGLHRLHCRGG